MNVKTYIAIGLFLFCAGGFSVFFYYNKQVTDYKKSISELTITNKQLIKDYTTIEELNRDITERQQNESEKLEEAKRLVDTLSRESGEAEITISGIIDAIDNLIKEFEDL